MRPVRDDALQAGAARRGRGASACPPSSAPSSSSACPTSASTSSTTRAVASDAARDASTSRYDKQYLLTFGEYLPFGDTFPILYKWSPNSGHFSPGHVARPAPARRRGATHPVTVLICYEDILPRFTNDAVRHADPELLVNMTNDAWFGDTAEPWEHLALAQLRAVEHRRYLVRGTNSGVSAVVDPVGRVVAHSGTFRQEAHLRARSTGCASHTVYERIGDWPWLLVSGGLIYLAFRRRQRTARPLGRASAQAS